MAWWASKPNRNWKNCNRNQHRALLVTEKKRRRNYGKKKMNKWSKESLKGKNLRKDAKSTKKSILICLSCVRAEIRPCRGVLLRKGEKDLRAKSLLRSCSHLNQKIRIEYLNGIKRQRRKRGFLKEKAKSSKKIMGQRWNLKHFQIKNKIMLWQVLKNAKLMSIWTNNAFKGWSIERKSKLKKGSNNKRLDNNLDLLKLFMRKI